MDTGPVQNGSRRGHDIMVWVALLVLHVLPGATPVQGHEARPAFIRITELPGDQYLTHTRIPASVPDYAIPSLIMPGHCTAEKTPVAAWYADAVILTSRYNCSGGISGGRTGLDYPVMNPGVSSLFRIKFLQGEVHNRILLPGEQQWVIPDRETIQGIALQYLSMGVRHIFAGIDHLLFVACLVFIAGTCRRIVVTITGFTLAHSLTLALSTLAIITLPIPPVEAVIALSIAFLAHEIAVGNRRSWTWRYPVGVAGVFGLLHGFGFAAVLRTTGLPQTELPAALLFFNLGVEAGQLLFVTAVALLLFLSRWCLQYRSATLIHPLLYRKTISYCIGTVAAFWLIERLSEFPIG